MVRTPRPLTVLGPRSTRVEPHGRVMRGLLHASVLLLLAASRIHGAEAAPQRVGPQGATPDGIACDASRDERQRLADALRSGGALAGRTLRLESGCKVLLGSPGSNGAALTLASDTRIECADATAGFVLARRSCHGGDLPGAACEPANRDADCPGGGRCTSDADAGPFAPKEDDVYTVIAAEPDSVGTGVSGCGIWVNGVSGDSTVMGGAGARYGYCSGGEHAGFSCSQQCSAEAGVLTGFACSRDADCGSLPGARCGATEQCSARGGTCGPPAPMTSWGPSGKGFINPVDLRNSVAAAVEQVTVYDHRKGLFAIAIGSGGRRVAILGAGRQANTTSSGASTVRGCTTDAATTRLTPAGVFFAEVYDPRPFVDTGIVGGAFESIVSDNDVAAYRFGIRAYASSTVSGNTVKLPTTVAAGASPLDATPRGEGLPRGIGLLASGNSSSFTGNQVTAYVGFLVEPSVGFNVTVANNRFFDGSGPKVAIPSGSGVIVTGNYLAWGSSDNLDCTGPGEPSGCCTGSKAGSCTGPGVIRIGNGDPGARAGRTDHVDVIGNLIHSDQPHATYVLLDAAGRRCTKGDRADHACTTDGDCADVASCSASGQPQACCSGPRTGSCTASCRPTQYGNSFISGNHFHSSTAQQTALDLSRLAFDATTLSGMTVAGNRIAGFGRGVVLPADARSIEGLDFLANDFDGTASPSAVCTGPATPFPCCSARGAGTCAVYEGWSWSMGERKGDAGLTPADEQPLFVTLASAGRTTISAGDAIAVARTGGGVERAARTTDATGIALTDAADGASVNVAVSGIASCRVSAAVAPGARLGVGSTPGKLETTDAGPSVGVALAAADAGATVRCLVSPVR